MSHHRSHRRWFAAVVSAAALALSAPATGEAATTVGALGSAAELIDDPPQPNCLAGRVYTQRSTSGTNNVTYDSPLGPSVITSWATTVNPRIAVGQTRRGALKILANNGNDSFTILASSEVQTLVRGSGATNNSVNRFAVRIPTPGGGQLAFAPADLTVMTPAHKCYFEPATAAPGNSVGHGPSSGEVGTTFTRDNTGGVGLRMSIEATFEPDADADGWGDETQDRCRGAAGDSEGCPAPAAPIVRLPVQSISAPDRTKPAVSGLGFSRSSFAAAASGSAFTSQKAKKKRKKRAPVGTKVSFRLSEASSVRFTVQRESSGRRSSGTCRKRTRSNRRKPKCKRYTSVPGSFTVRGQAGSNSFTFRGRVGGKGLKTGRYRLSGTATDAAKNVSAAPTRKAFTIVR